MVASDGENGWVDALAVEEVEEEDVMPVSIGDRSIAVYRSPDDSLYATDGICTHEHALLGDGLVLGHEIECPKHNGRFDYTTGEPTRTPACAALRTYPVKVSEGRILVQLD